jgi:hypothetical protein
VHKNKGNHRILERQSPLGRVYSFILSWSYPEEEKAEPAATDLGRERAAGSECKAPASAGEASSINQSEIHQTKLEMETPKCSINANPEISNC